MPHPKCKAVATGIYRLPSGKLRIEFSTGRKTESGRYEIYRETFDGSVKDAITRRAGLIAKYAEGRLRVPERGITLGRYFEKFFEYNRQRVASGKIAQSTADFYEQSLRRHFAGLWDRPLGKITKDEAIETLTGIKVANRSADYMLSIFHAFRAAWNAQKRLKVQPPDILDDVAAVMPPPVKHRRRILQPREILRLMNAAEDPITRGVIACLATTTMRINECLGLRETDIDEKNMIIAVEQQRLKKKAPNGNLFGPHKTYKKVGTRYIRMTRFLAKELKKVRAAVAQMKLKAGEHWQDHGLVFPSSKGTPISYSYWESSRFVPLFAKAKVPRVRAHDLRHSTATFLLSQGVPIPVVMEICGHVEVRTTMEYTHLLVAAQDEAMQRLDEAYQE